MTAPAPPRDRGRLILIGLLAVSLLGNAVAVGAVLRLNAARHELFGTDAGEALFPRDYRRDFRAELAADPALRAALRDAIEARKAVVRAGTARPFDRGATEAAMDSFGARAGEVLSLSQAAILKALEARAAKD